MKKPHITNVMTAFHFYQQESMRALTQNKAGSAIQRIAFKQAQEHLKDRLDKLGLKDAFDWTELD